MSLLLHRPANAERAEGWHESTTGNAGIQRESVAFSIFQEAVYRCDDGEYVPSSTHSESGTSSSAEMCSAIYSFSI